MLISSDMSTPILSRSSGCPLTSKVAIVTMHCHMFFACFVFYVTLLNSFTYLIYFYPCVHSDACAVCNRMATTTPKNPRMFTLEGYVDWSMIGPADWSIGGITLNIY